MAKASYITVSPSSGSGDGTVSVGATVHTGRDPRTSALTVTGAGVQGNIQIPVSQTGKTEFVSLTDGATKSVGKAGGTVNITGLSNSSKLTFSVLGNAVDGDGNQVDSATNTNYAELTLPANYTAGGVSTANGAAIQGDPGAAQQYSFSIALSIPVNSTTQTIHRTLVATDNAGNTAQIDIVQAAENPTLSVSVNSLTIPADGSAVTFNIMSNTNWTIS